MSCSCEVLKVGGFSWAKSAFYWVLSRGTMGPCPPCLWETANFWLEIHRLINSVIKKIEIKAIFKNLETFNPLRLVI